MTAEMLQPELSAARMVCFDGGRVFAAQAVVNHTPGIGALYSKGWR
jgi:hypothetical protein